MPLVNEGNNGTAHGTGQSPIKCHAQPKLRPSLDRPAVSQNPPPGLYLGTPEREPFMESLAYCCASAYLQTCPNHELHAGYMLGARDNRARITPQRRQHGRYTSNDPRHGAATTPAPSAPGESQRLDSPA